MSQDLAQQFANAIIATGQTYQNLDFIYLTNQIYALVGHDQLSTLEDGTDLVTLAQTLVARAVMNGKITDTTAARDILEAQLTNFYTPAPSKVNQVFWDEYQAEPQQATNYFYNLSKANNYIKTAAIAKNISYNVNMAYGDLEITINLSKPEKDPKEIALAKSQPKTNYPLDQLSIENEGYLGRVDFPARTNHRIVRVMLNGETWGMQYSPYAYFNEHCIFLSAAHRPMHIDAATISNLLEIVRLFPHYFVGSNADLPIVGGSMLSQDHYQGGRHDFPMAKASIDRPIKITAFPNMKAGIVKWPMSVIRLESNDVQALVNCGDYILKHWQNYSDPSVSIRAQINGEPHHTITPIVRRTSANGYQLDLVLRDNQTSAEFPDGIFHPHQDVQHIKKENIGLIEVMGRAILPARLKTELVEVEKYLLEQPNEMKAYHQIWADELKQKYNFTAENIHSIVQKEVGYVFARVLEDAGVFKRSAKGQAAFDRFIEEL
ncbi:UDP-glucose--hexose-1-phosphate uridylyltransferase [Agrilactobacillus fermenti]|uniref:UDP-glucose--hexose-1-phosphate uridylyltransferase n=1 Tax=Agrilactobacillus fermenti TaxID=2586909 RepID=UPI003A5BEE1B